MYSRELYVCKKTKEQLIEPGFVLRINVIWIGTGFFADFDKSCTKQYDVQHRFAFVKNLPTLPTLWTCMHGSLRSQKRNIIGFAISDFFQSRSIGLRDSFCELL